MALMPGKLYHALRTGAAEEVADYEKDLADLRSDVRVLKWITGTTLAGVITLIVRSLSG